MKIMTFNLRCDCVFDFKNRWVTRKNIVSEIMNMYNCDVIGTQEVTNSMLKDIMQEVKNYNIFGKIKAKSLLQERADFFISKKHKVIHNKIFWLSKNPYKQSRSTWYSIFPRICNTVLIELENNKKVRVYNTHLDCFFEKIRKYELSRIMDYVKFKDEEENIPIILMGDFNAEPDSALIKDFLNSNFNNKKFKAVQDFNNEIYKQSTMSDFRGRKTGLHIDYIFVSEDIEVKNVEIINYNISGKYPSDHYPLMADIKLSNR